MGSELHRYLFPILFLFRCFFPISLTPEVFSTFFFTLLSNRCEIRLSLVGVERMGTEKRKKKLEILPSRIYNLFSSY